MKREGVGAFIGAGTPEDLARSILNTGQLAYLALRTDGVVVYASESTRTVTTWEPSALVGGNALDWLHPDDAERALLQLSELNVVGSTPGTSLFRIRRSDGSYASLEVMGSIVSDGEETLIGLWLRDAANQLFLEDLLFQLVHGAKRGEALRLVCDAVDWQQFGSSVAIAWVDDGGTQQVDTGLPVALGGCEASPGSPWERARERGVAQHGTAADLSEPLGEMASELGLGAFWVEPVPWAPDSPPATITIWTEAGPRAPGIHAYGMGLVRNLVELVMRWTDQADRLDLAARSDSLTGLLNHRTFYSILRDSSAGGAVLYCDLDRFKPVNEEHGHFVGDTLLRLAAQRIQSSVRQADVVGRLGGDEFAVLCYGVNEAGALDVAHRILQALRQPFRLSDDAPDVTLDASIGVAVSTEPMTEDQLRDADRALSTAKAGGRGRVVMAPPSPPSPSPPPPGADPEGDAGGTSGAAT